MQKLDKETARNIAELINTIEVSYIMTDAGYDEQRWFENRNEALNELKQKYNIGE